jgi:hypothetical protein
MMLAIAEQLIYCSKDIYMKPWQNLQTNKELALYT